MIKTNLLGTQPTCEQEYTPVCTDDGILFGPKTGQKVVVSLSDGELIRLDAFNIGASIKIYLLDRDPGAACADCGTGFRKPYAPCGDCSPKSLETWNTTEYVRGPGVFEFESAGIAGTPLVKMVKLNAVAYEEFCKKCEPPKAVCAKPTLILAATQTQITATVTNGPGTITMMPGNVSLLGSGPFIFKKLEEDTQYSFTFKNDCGETVSGVTETSISTCPTPTLELNSTGTEITATVTNGPGTITINPGGLSLVGSGPFVFKKLQNDTQYALTFVSDCGSSVSGTIETAPAIIPPVIEEVVYCASMALPGGGFYYHYADSRDPTATVEFKDCAGTLLGYVHPTPGPGHTVQITSCCPTPTTIGWGVNRSNCNVEPNMTEVYQALCGVEKPSCGCSEPASIVTTDVSVTSEQSFFVTSPNLGPSVGSSGTVTFKIRNTGNNSDASKFFWSFPSGLNVNSVSVTYIGGANGMSLPTAQSGQTNVNLPNGGGADVVFVVTAAIAGPKVVNGNVTTPLSDTNSANNSTQQTVIVI
jgi:hypothetical protein